MILGCEAIIYQYQWDLLQGDTGGAVRYFDGVHLFKEVAFGERTGPSLFVQHLLRTIRVRGVERTKLVIHELGKKPMHTDGIEAKESVPRRWLCKIEILPWHFTWYSLPVKINFGGRYGDVVDEVKLERADVRTRFWLPPKAPNR
jgi:hypothetical protein